MRESNETKVRRQKRSVLAAVVLTGALAAAGCTTNRTPGDGQPTSTPTSGPTIPVVTPGSSSGTSPQALKKPLSSTDAIAVLEADAAYRGKVLGPSNPGKGAGAVTTSRVAPAKPPATLPVAPVYTTNSDGSVTPVPKP